MEERTAMKRRGILAAAGAVVAGIVAKQTSQPVAASSGGGDQGPLNLGSNPWYLAGVPLNTNNQAAVSSEPTVIQASPNFNNYTGFNGGHRVVLEIDASTNTSQANGNHSIVGIHAVGYGGGDGVDGHSDSGYGVYGESVTSYGVSGWGPYGVIGSGNGTGSPSVGVWGTAGGAGANSIGTVGINVDTANGTIGVQGLMVGVAGGTNTVAVQGVNQSTGAGGVGVQGIGGLYGVVGVASNQGGSAGVLGYTSQANGVAFASVVTAPATLAGYFNGVVHVNGPFVVDNPANKHGAIDAADGSTRLVYSMESPESWIEDFGTGTLAGGKAEIKLDPAFAGIIHTDDYHVFLTDHAKQHLSVTQRGAGGFTVEADGEVAALKGKKASDLNGTFSYRVVARPNVGRQVERLPKYTRPVFDVAAVEKMAKAASARPVATPPVGRDAPTPKGG